MDRLYYIKLQPDVRSMVHEIEQNIGYEINIKVDKSRKDTLACEVEKHGSTILIPNADYFRDNSVLHELLHIRRFCLDKVPRIVVCKNSKAWTPELENGIRELDNHIEHFIIVPEELKIRTERKKYWKSHIENVLNKFHSLNHAKDDKERLMLIYWAFIHHVLPEGTLIEKAIDLVDSLDITDRTSPFLNELIPCLPKKEKLVEVFFKHLCIPIDIWCMEYLDCKNRSSYIKPLAMLTT